MEVQEVIQWTGHWTLKHKILYSIPGRYALIVCLSVSFSLSHWLWKEKTLVIKSLAEVLGERHTLCILYPDKIQKCLCVITVCGGGGDKVTQKQIRKHESKSGWIEVLVILSFCNFWKLRISHKVFKNIYSYEDYSLLCS